MNMRRKWSLKKRTCFLRVYEQGVAKADRYLVVKSVINDLGFTRYGFSVTKSIGNAVVRNHTRRVLKEIVRVMQIKPGWDIVFIARPNIINADFNTLHRSVMKLLDRADLLLYRNETVSTKVH